MGWWWGDTPRPVGGLVVRIAPVLFELTQDFIALCDFLADECDAVLSVNLEIDKLIKLVYQVPFAFDKLVKCSQFYGYRYVD